MPKTLLICPLVGAAYRPPAKAVLQVLPSRAQVSLVPEPDNPYDPNAIQVWIDPKETIPVGQMLGLDEALEGTGWDVHQLMDLAGGLMLGYLADSKGKVFAKLQEQVAEKIWGNLELTEMVAQIQGETTTELCWLSNGAPAVKVTIEGASP